MTTGIKILMIAVVYMFVMFVVSAYIPFDDFIVSSGRFDDVEFDFNATGSHQDSDNVDVFDVFVGLLTFGGSGAAVPWWLSILAFYIPVFMIGLGTYAIIRGI